MVIEASDCLWLILENTRDTITFPTSLMRDFDWKTRGFLSRVVRGERALTETVFIPSEGKLPAKIVALDTVKTFDPEKFTKNTLGLKAEKVVVLFENEKVKHQIESNLIKNKIGNLFKNCHCFEDQP